MFISMTWSEGVTEHESKIAVDTVKQVLYWLYLRHPDALIEPPVQIRPLGNWVIPALMPDKPYWGTQWYIDSSYDDQLERVIAPTFLELVRREPWQQSDAHWDLALIDDDLTDFPVPLARVRPDRYTLGSSLPGTSAIMSVHRLRQLDPTMAELSLARLVRHHLGHVMGIPELTRRQATARLGVELHCTNRCAMRNAATVEELAELALEESEMGWGFCELCTKELHSIIVQHSCVWS